MIRSGLRLTALGAALLVTLAGSQAAFAQTAHKIISQSKYCTIKRFTADTGTEYDRVEINGPPPPAGYKAESAAADPIERDQMMSAKTLTVPAYEWIYGCSSVSGAMIAAYYDRNGYPNMYTGPTNGGVMPLTDSWTTWTDGNGDTYPLNPLIASKNGLDGRSSKGSLDDYWVAYNSTAQDPYITGKWTQHTWNAAIGDYMKTSQSSCSNEDGSTAFYNNINTSAALTCTEMESASDTSLGKLIKDLDGTYGRKLFYESKGYTVSQCYNQRTDNNGGGFTFAMYKAEIDAGRPVMVNLNGHTVVGIGYDDSTNPGTVKIHDTWDTLTHNLTWGGTYTAGTFSGGMLSVSIVNLSGGTMTTTTIPPSGTTTTVPGGTTSIGTTSIPGTSTYVSSVSTTAIPTTTAMPGTPLVADFSGCQDLDLPGPVQFLNQSTGTITSWAWSFGDGITSSDPNPLHTYSMNGSYSVSLAVTDSYGDTDYLVEDSCITIGSCDITADFTATPVRGSAPLSVKFTSDVTGPATVYVWIFGDGKNSTEQNPVHLYQSKGDYLVLLMARNNECAASVVKAKYIHVMGRFGILSDLCPLLQSVSGRPGAEDYASALRNFRDHRLGATAHGAFLTMLYYMNSAEVTSILEANPDMEREFGNVVEAYAPRIGQGLALGSPAAFNPLEIARVESLLESIGEKGSPLLKVSIRYVLRQMQRRGFLRQYGIEAQP